MSARCLFILLAMLSGCGAKTGVLWVSSDASSRPIDAIDGAVSDSAVRDAGPDAEHPVDGGICEPAPDGCGRAEVCGNGSNDDCDSVVDEGCACEPGAVQRCFGALPGQRNRGICTDGSQICGMDGRWGVCSGAILPRPGVCDGRDTQCDGCSARRDCELNCPSPGDVTIGEGEPFAPYLLPGGQFYPGRARSWRWQIEGGACDRFAPNLVSFDLLDATSSTATFVPRLSGDYNVTLNVVTELGTDLSCSWQIPVRGPGLRVEMCYPESSTQDLDLFVHRPNDMAPWYPSGGNAHDATPSSCGWHNCEARLRADPPLPRADWGYPASPLGACVNGPEGSSWAELGFCPNPRLDIDNNLVIGTGLPENINIDAPRDGETFRVMVQNFSGERAQPLVNVYCEGRRVGTYGAPPDIVPEFAGTDGDLGVGAMWRVVDVTTRIGPEGRLECDLALVHPPGSDRGYDVTYDDPRY